MRLPTAPMLAAPTTRPLLPSNWMAEPKWDGFRALVARWSDGRVAVRSRQGTDLTPAFPEIAAAAQALPAGLGDVLFDGELVIWHEGRLDFEMLQSRLGRKPAVSRRLAAASPASHVVFDLLHLGGEPIGGRPYRERRALLEGLFADFRLQPPWTLCPASPDPADVATWLEVWPALGIEGVCFKNPDQSYQPGRRGWLKYRLRSSTEAVIGAVTGSLARPDTLLLGRFDGEGTLCYAGRTLPLDAGAGAALAGRLTPARPGHPWAGREFASRWRPATPTEAILVEPDLVAEVSADTGRSRDGSWRHLVRLLRTRPDLAPADTPLITAGDEPVAG